MIINIINETYVVEVCVKLMRIMMFIWRKYLKKWDERAFCVILFVISHVCGPFLYICALTLNFLNITNIYFLIIKYVFPSHSLTKFNILYFLTMYCTSNYIGNYMFAKYTRALKTIEKKIINRVHKSNILFFWRNLERQKLRNSAVDWITHASMYIYS